MPLYRYTPKQRSLLMSEFCRCPYISSKQKERLSEKLGKGVREIGDWFDRQRTRIRQLEAQVTWKGNHDLLSLFLIFSLCVFLSLCVLFC